MKISREFHLSERKKRSAKRPRIVMVFGGILLLMFSCYLFASMDTEGSYILSCFLVSVPIAGFLITYGGIEEYININRRKWKLAVSEWGISEVGHISKKDDWRFPWNEIQKMIPPSPQESYKQAFFLLTQKQPGVQQREIKVSGYDNLYKIYNYAKECRQKDLNKQKEYIENQEKMQAEKIVEEKFIHQQQERDYFRRIKRLEDIQKIDPIQFEKIIFALFKRMGYDVLLTKASRDEGIDLILSKNGKKSVVQCKRYSGTVGQPIARDLYGSMIHNRAEDAYLITTGVFSLPAQTWASGKPIHLVDGKMLVEWLETILDKDEIG